MLGMYCKEDEETSQNWTVIFWNDATSVYPHLKPGSSTPCTRIALVYNQQCLSHAPVWHPRLPSQKHGFPLRPCFVWGPSSKLLPSWAVLLVLREVILGAAEDPHKGLATAYTTILCTNITVEWCSPFSMYCHWHNECFLAASPLGHL